jgi:defect-in-organelle-trafficking protein DotC
LNRKGKNVNAKRTEQKRGKAVFKLVATHCFATALTALAFNVPSASAQTVPLSLSEVQAQVPTGVTLDGAKDVALRLKAMQEAAHSYGARSGLLRRSYEIRKSLDVAAPHLDATWNFSALMLVDKQAGEDADSRYRNVIPPVIVQADRNFKQDGPTVIRTVDKVYRIESQARFASVPPTWRAYLFRDLGEKVATLPHSSLMPRTPEERTRWQGWVEEGWMAGVAQANSFFEVDLNRLSRDFNGMVLYHELVMKKMVSLPHVATLNAGVTGDESTLNINDVALRITVMPGFRQDSSKWVPVSH